MVCSEVFRIAENFEGDKIPFFRALNYAEMVFRDDEGVQSEFDRLREEKGHDNILIPNIIEVMGQAVNIKVEKKRLVKPFSPANKNKKGSV